MRSPQHPIGGLAPARQRLPLTGERPHCMLPVRWSRFGHPPIGPT